MSKSRSVFGVDTLWEREMVKLRGIEAHEAEERTKREAAEAAEAAKRDKRKGKKGKGKRKEPERSTIAASNSEPHVSAEPPVLPDIPKATTRGRPPNNDEETESESNSDENVIPRVGRASVETEKWFAGSSDDEKAGPVRTTGIGPRYPKRLRGHPSATQLDDDSEEDVPLAATVDRALQRATRLGPPVAADDDSDEEKPLSALLNKVKVDVAIDFDNLYSAPSAEKKSMHAAEGQDEDEDEDNQPLGLRASRVLSTMSQTGVVEDDDTPLAFHPEQQRRTQYNMMLQQQQQQQQMFMQAQMQNSMMFSNPAFMGSNFFGAPMPPPMMMAMPQAAPINPPPPMEETAKFGRVDKWRHDVAVEGQT